MRAEPHRLAVTVAEPRALATPHLLDPPAPPRESGLGPPRPARLESSSANRLESSPMVRSAPPEAPHRHSPVLDSSSATRPESSVAAHLDVPHLQVVRLVPAPRPRLLPAVQIRSPIGAWRRRRADTGHVVVALVALIWFCVGVITTGKVVARLMFWLVGT